MSTPLSTIVLLLVVDVDGSIFFLNSFLLSFDSEVFSRWLFRLTFNLLECADVFKLDEILFVDTDSIDSLSDVDLIGSLLLFLYKILSSLIGPVICFTFTESAELVVVFE